jgi:hypothetical protein
MPPGFLVLPPAVLVVPPECKLAKPKLNEYCSKFNPAVRSDYVMHIQSIQAVLTHLNMLAAEILMYQSIH